MSWRVRPAALRRCALGALVAVLAGCAASAYVVRLESLALLQTLNAELLSHDSATATLERWCATHHLATPPRIVADRVRDTDRQPSAQQREVLGVSADEPVRYRRVRLRCGEVVMSEADNWYVPSRLSPAMNEQLDTSDTPFGRVLQPLKFQRRTLSAELLWQPLPEDWALRPRSSRGAGVSATMPAEVLRHRALLMLPDGRPISLVVETYRREAVTVPASPQPGIRRQ